MNTIMGGATGGIATVFLKPRLLGTYSFVSRFDVVALCSGILVGLVAITGCCDRVEVWAAFIIGTVSALFYILGCWLLDRFHIDDPVEAVQVHMFGGIWGTLATGLFSNPDGLFYGGPGCGTYFGYQVLGLVVIIAWIGGVSSVIFYILNRLNLLRVDKAMEIIGLI